MKPGRLIFCLYFTAGYQMQYPVWKVIRPIRYIIADIQSIARYPDRYPVSTRISESVCGIRASTRTGHPAHIRAIHPAFLYL